jgi:ATP-dependent Lon protease
MEIGGLKEKVIAAHRAGIKTIIAPKDNEKDMEDIPDRVKKDIKFVFATKLDDVLKVALQKWPAVEVKDNFSSTRPTFLTVN